MSASTGGALAPSAPVALVEGDEMPTATVGPVTRTDIVRYAGAGGDFNPIHHDEPFAQSVGMPSVFSMGMLQGGVLAQRLARWVGPENVVTLSMRFTGQVWPDDMLTMSGRVTGVGEDPEHGRVADVEAKIARGPAGEEVVVKVTARVRAA